MAMTQVQKNAEVAIRLRPSGCSIHFSGLAERLFSKMARSGQNRFPTPNTITLYAFSMT